MKAPDRLAALVQLQSLRERRERVQAERARQAVASGERAHSQCLADEAAVQEAMFAESREPRLCLDRWRLLAGQLNLNADLTHAASAKLVAAREDFDAARDQLKREIARTAELEVRARKAARKFAAKKDEARLQDVRSLSAGVMRSAWK